MVSYEKMQKAIERVADEWGEDIAVTAIIAPNKQRWSLDEYLNIHCYTCGGNWGAWFLTGVKSLFPQIYNMIPENMGYDGNYAFGTICALLTILGIDMES